MIQFYRVRRGENAVWFVDVGSERRLLWWKTKYWERYITTDNGNTWSTMEEHPGGWYPSFMIDPRDMKRIDVLIGVLLPYLRAAGLENQAVKLREKQEDYWKRQKWIHEQAGSVEVQP